MDRQLKHIFFRATPKLFCVLSLVFSNCTPKRGNEDEGVKSVVARDSLPSTWLDLCKMSTNTASSVPTESADPKRKEQVPPPVIEEPDATGTGQLDAPTSLLLTKKKPAPASNAKSSTVKVAKVGKEVAKTINEMRNAVQKAVSGKNQKIGKDCDSVWQHLSKIEELSITNKKIVDVYPISLVPNLKRLNLLGNKIVLADDLRNLTHLQYLNLLGNPLKNKLACPVSGLTKEMCTLAKKSNK